MIAADGSVVWFRELERVIRTPDGLPVSTAGVLIDITGQREAEAALRSGEELNRSIVSALDEGVVVIDRSGRYLQANASAARISGIPVEEILGSRAPLPGVDLYFEDGTRATPENARETVALREGVAFRDVTCRLVRRDGAERWVSVNYQPLPGAPGEPPRGVACSFVDITERRAAERQIAELAYHDPLTGLPNRALLEEHLALQLAQSRQFRHVLFHSFGSFFRVLRIYYRASYPFRMFSPTPRRSVVVPGQGHFSATCESRHSGLHLAGRHYSKANLT